MKLIQNQLQTNLQHSQEPTNSHNAPNAVSGTVEKVLFSNVENGYTVCRLQGHDKQLGTITLCGTLPTVQAGHVLQANGTWSTHPKFGAQFTVTSFSVQPPSSAAGMEKYLASGLIKGIGPVYAQRLVAFFGTEVLNIIAHQPEKLGQIPGIGPKRVEQIKTAWIEQKEIAHIMLFLQEKGIPTTHATKIYKTYKDKSIEKILENPYRLAEDIWGVGFTTADTIAQSLGVALDSVKRCRAALQHVVTSALQNGHVYVELEELKEKTYELLNVPVQEVASNVKLALHDLYNNEKIKLLSLHEKHFVTLTNYYVTEKGIAERVQHLLGYGSEQKFDIDSIYTRIRTTTDTLALNDDQQRGIINCLQHNVSIITGGPGTGKTTLIKALLDILDAETLVVKLAAPTGRAAKRITQSTGRIAITIHRLLEFDPAVMQFTRNAQNALDVDVLIIDEASMIDIFLMHALCKAVKSGTRILLIGDVDQLPSVGAGNVLNDCIESGIVPTVRLMHIFRQAHNSLIVTNAHRINNGEFFITHDEQCKRDFFFIKEEDPLQIPHHLRTIFSSMLGRMQVRKEDTAVLVPMNRGPAGTVTLNHSLQKLLNPTPGPHVLYGSYTFKLHDRVMQVRNNYDKLVFNGDIGVIIEIDEAERTLLVQFDTSAVPYEFTELDELTLAYAISVHKSQGSEYQAAIITVFMQHFTLLQRRLLYTAITRAKKLCIVIGQPKALWLAIKNHNSAPRITFLKEFLKSDICAR